MLIMYPHLLILSDDEPPFQYIVRLSCFKLMIIVQFAYDTTKRPIIL